MPLLRYTMAVLVAATLMGSAADAQEPGVTTCEDVPGIEPLLQPGVVLLFGEMHGTNESPQFIGRVLCRALQAKLAVRVGLELPHSETAYVQSYLRTTDEAEAEQQLLQAPSWQHAYQAGKTSCAMLNLLRRIRSFHAAGFPLNVLLFDEPKAGRQRDSVMAERLKQAVTAFPNDLLLVLTGNVHNRLVRGTQWNEEYEPMGYFLQQHMPEQTLYALNAAHAGGTAWVCFGTEPADCGTQRIGPSHAGIKPPRIVLDTTLEAYSGWYAIGSLTASLPATRTDE